MYGNYNGSNGDQQSPQIPSKLNLYVWADLLVRALSGKAPKEFCPILWACERPFREILQNVGYSQHDAMVCADNFHMFAFEELERIWDNKTWAKGLR